MIVRACFVSITRYKSMKKTIFAAIFLSASMQVVADCALNPEVRQDNIAETICDSEWLDEVRPPSSYTNAIKRTLVKRLGLPPTREVLKQFELDHKCPLSSGGHPYSEENLALQEWKGPLGAYAKDGVERKVARRVCAGEMTLDEAQTIFLTDEWKNMVKGAVSSNLSNQEEVQ